MTTTSASTARPANRMAALDGIRTVAVFLVILFHVSTPFMAAGYIGVDIFFVLSGYLITAGLVREVARKGRPSLKNFWVRRFKRLMPAALLTLAAVTVWMLWFAPLYRMHSVSTDLWWTLLYVANWHLMASNSYFADTGAESPLLHMWSLAVEEQFYVAWPLLVVVCVWIALAWRRRSSARRGDHAATFNRVAGWLVVGLIVASAAALFLLYDPASPDRAYMGTDAKAFEPLLGALAAIVLTNPTVKGWIARHHQWVSAAGVVVMLALFPFLDGPAPFYYQWGALVFSLGALATITGLVLAEGRGLLARVLGWEPIAYLGRISYGLYLWHWPIALWIIGDLEGFRWARALAVIGATFVAAALSYHLVEMPVRTGKWFTPLRSLLVAVVSLAVMLVAVSFGGGTPLSPLVNRAAPDADLDKGIILLVGDSVPQRFTPALEEAAAKHQLQVANATGGGCAPDGRAIPLTVGEPDVECWPVLDKQAQMLEQFTPATIVWWSRYELADMRVDGEVIGPDQERFWELSQASLDQTAGRLTADGATLVFVATDRISKAVYAQCTPAKCHPFLDRLAHHDEYRQRWNQMLDAYARSHPNTRVIQVDDLYCKDAAVPCDDYTDGVPARKDGSHFSDEKVMPRIADGVLDRIVAAAGLQ